MKNERIKSMFRNHKYSWFAIFCLAAILTIVVCNLWQLCCGHCALGDFLRIPLIGWVLIAANLAAGLVLFSMKRRNGKPSAGDNCGLCHIILREGWAYCPNCGDAHGSLR